MKKSQELLRPDSCLSKADPEEMLFVLRSKDRAAPAAIRAWVRERVLLGLNNANDDKLIEALRCAATMTAERQARVKVWRKRTKTRRDRLPIAEPQTLSHILGLVSWDVPVEAINSWAPDVRDEVQEWAAREHFGASDNPVRRRPLPMILINDPRCKQLSLSPQRSLCFPREATLYRRT
jgi:hypothetical protein